MSSIDLEKTIVWDKSLGEQSESVKKAIEPFLTWEFAYYNELGFAYYDEVPENEQLKKFWEAKDKEDPNYIKDYLLKKCSHLNLADELHRLGHVNREVRFPDFLESIGIDHLIEYESVLYPSGLIPDLRPSSLLQILTLMVRIISFFHYFILSFSLQFFIFLYFIDRP